MRRITPKYVQKGMMLGLPVYDAYGNQIYERNTEVDSKVKETLLSKSVPEIYVDDIRTNDIVVAPMVAPHLEGRLAQYYRALIEEARQKNSINKGRIEQLVAIVNTIAKDLTLDTIGEINASFIIIARDYLYLQPVKAAILAMAIGHRLGIKSADLSQLGTAVLFKDIGYLYYPAVKINNVLVGDEDEMALKEHPALGRKLLTSLGITSEASNAAVLQHHEQWNGRGYPAGLKENQISRFAQIAAMADQFTNLLAERPGQTKYMTYQSVEYIMAYGGEVFNPELVESFVRMIPCFASGLTLILNTGEIAVVSNPNLGFVARPIVRICYQPEKGYLEDPYDIDLAKSEFQSRLITKILEYD